MKMMLRFKKIKSWICEYGVCGTLQCILNRIRHNHIRKKDARKIHLISKEQMERQRETKFSANIKISIITPLFNTPKTYLIELIKSLKEQTYENWELCLADGSDENHSYVRKICEDSAREDERIAYHRLDKNEGISGNTNKCIEFATGDYIGLLDHDDLLHPSALYEVIYVIQSQNADFIYTDEVKFSGDIRNITNLNDFNFKPGFGKYDLRAHNYICHFTVFSKKLLEQESRFYRKEYDGSQDHDMVLRLTERAEKIVHIPKVLYYWRVHEGSVSMNVNVKPYAVDAAIRAVKAQIERNQIKGEVTSDLTFRTLYRVKYDIISRPTISIVFHDYHEAAYKSIEKTLSITSYRPIEILYYAENDINIAGKDGVSFVNIKKNKDISKIERWNTLVKNATGQYIIFMSVSSIPLEDNWITEMLMLCQQEDVFAVGPKIVYKDKKIAYAGLSLFRESHNGLVLIGKHNYQWDAGYEAILSHVRNTTAALSACMMFAKKDWEEVGGFTDRFIHYEDIDFCINGLKRGKNNVWTCYALIEYLKKNILPVINNNEADFFKKEHEYIIDQDCSYNKNWNKWKLV